MNKIPLKDENAVIYVLAGNHKEYLNYLNSKKITSQNARYISSIQTIQGVINPRIVKYGTWYSRRDYEEIKDTIIAHLGEMSRYEDERTETKSRGQNEQR